MAQETQDLTGIDFQVEIIQMGRAANAKTYVEGDPISALELWLTLHLVN